MHGKEGGYRDVAVFLLSSFILVLALNPRPKTLIISLYYHPTPILWKLA